MLSMGVRIGDNHWRFPACCSLEVARRALLLQTPAWSTLVVTQPCGSVHSMFSMTNKSQGLPRRASGAEPH